LTDPEQFGLKEDWDSVEQILLDIIPVYDKTNRYISLGTDLRIRKIGLEWIKQGLAQEGEPLVLDLGSGTGRMTQLLGTPTVMIDALIPMTRVARKRNPASDGVISVFENLPLASGIANAAIAGFAIRDARKLSNALEEINRTLKQGGLFLVVDLSKPDSRINRGLVRFYWRIIAPAIAFVVAGRVGLKFAALSTTYNRLPTNKEYVELARSKGFNVIKSKYFLLGGASVLVLRKSSSKS
jgi:demethylmenaquinone methyltransferase / 2-methoxy-6-polyprenyl-1,4-benzoquinol methylase